MSPRHRAKEFIRFLKKIDRTVAKHLDLHLIVDNYTTHKTKEVQAWLERHPRFKLHFIPTSSSWLNLVERFFAEITGKRIRRGVFQSVAELEAAIDDYLAKNNASPKPFVWTKTANIILEKHQRARTVLGAVINGRQALSRNTSVKVPVPGFAFLGRMALRTIVARCASAPRKLKAGVPSARRRVCAWRAQGGAPGRSHRLALARLVRRSFVCEEEQLPGFSQMPLHVISQHGEEDMGLHAALKPVADRADLKVHALERAEGAFHFGQAFVIQDGCFGAHAGLGGGRANDIEAIQGRFGGGALFIDAEGERGILDIEIEVLADLVFPMTLPTRTPILSPLTDGRRRPGRNLFQRALRGGDQLLAFGRAEPRRLRGLRQATSRSPG